MRKGLCRRYLFLAVILGFVGFLVYTVNHADKVTAMKAKTMDQMADVYPLEYNSYHQNKVKRDGSTHGHLVLKNRMLAPVDRKYTTLLTNAKGDYAISGMEYNDSIKRWVISEEKYGAPAVNHEVSGKHITQGCFACKSSKFNDAYAKEGAGVFSAELTDDFEENLNAQILDCAVCHGDVPENKADARIVYWRMLARDTFDSFDASERACGQCHNSLGYKPLIKTQEQMDSFSPYRYGIDFDSLILAAIEDGNTKLDKDTGIVFIGLNDHPEIEFTQDSVMHGLGVTCITCHMPMVTDAETGITYRSHNSSGSPLESEASLNYCLSCHKAQGLNSPEEMAAMVRELQAKTQLEEEELRDKLKLTYNLIKEANQNGTADEDVLQQDREAYARAEIYFRGVVGSTDVKAGTNELADLGVKVSHNPAGTEEYISAANELLDDIIADLQ